MSSNIKYKIVQKWNIDTKGSSFHYQFKFNRLGGYLLLSLVRLRLLKFSCRQRRQPVTVAFSKEEVEVQKQTVPFVPARYIQLFDVTSNVNRILLKSWQMFEETFPHVAQHAISELLKQVF